MSSVAVNTVDKFKIRDNDDRPDLYYCVVFGEEIWVVEEGKHVYSEHVAEPITEQELQRFSNELTRAVGEEKLCDDTDLPNNWEEDKRPIDSIEHIRVIGKHMDDGDIIIEVIGEQYVSESNDEQITDKKLYEAKPHGTNTEPISKYTRMSLPKAEQQLDVIEQLINIPEITVDDPYRLSAFRSDEVVTPDEIEETIADQHPPVRYEIWIEQTTTPDDVELTNTSSVKLDDYEIGCNTNGEHQLKDDLHYNIESDFDGNVFEIQSSAAMVPMAFTCLLTEWECDEDGNADNIVIPDPPYDSGHFKLPPGTYRAWTETHEITDEPQNTDTDEQKTEETERQTD